MNRKNVDTNTEDDEKGDDEGNSTIRQNQQQHVASRKKPIST